MMIYVKGGPTNSNNKNLPVLDLNNYHSETRYEIGIPKVWNFKPFYFGKEDTDTIFLKPLYRR